MGNYLVEGCWGFGVSCGIEKKGGAPMSPPFFPVIRCNKVAMTAGWCRDITH